MNERAELESYFTVAELAEFLRVSTRSVRRWIENSELAAYRIGRSIRVARSSLDAFLAARSLKPAGT